MTLHGVGSKAVLDDFQVGRPLQFALIAEFPCLDGRLHPAAEVADGTVAR